ncbi:MAG TPA: TetR/AcrR family transcriptional regulator [Polyangiaceae bacterium]|nr:TetR/AcrR family transcriptional regulator [Polyangiaceae bacterium]
MSKADDTRGRILHQAIRLGSLVGLEGLTLGRLAEELRLSKSGLYAHFASKENLQVAVLENYADEFRRNVIEPAIREPRGEPRVVALFDRWLRWVSTDGLPGGCLFVAAATELDDRPGPVRDTLVRMQQAWLGAIVRSLSIAQDEGHYDRTLDADQLAFELNGLMLSFHHQSRLLREPDALARVSQAFAAFRERARGHQGQPLRYRELLRHAGVDAWGSESGV